MTVRKDQEKFARALYHLLECVGVMIFPMGIGMAIAAPQIVGAILGNRWYEIEPLIVWLTFGSALILIGSLLANAIETALHLNAKFYGQFFALLGGAVLFAVLTMHGLFAACVAFVAACLIYFLVQAYLAKVILQLSLYRLLSSFAPGMVTGAVISIYILAVQSALTSYSTVTLLIIFDRKTRQGCEAANSS